MDSILNIVKENDPSSINAEMITKLLSVKPGWKESNFQVINFPLVLIIIVYVLI